MTAYPQSLPYSDVMISKHAYDSALKEMVHRLRELRSPNRILLVKLSLLSPGLQRLWLDEADQVLRATIDILFEREIEVVD